jgi:hypothetical protein
VTYKALLFGQREIFDSGMMEFFLKSREWVGGVHSSLGIRAIPRVDNHGSQKIKYPVLIYTSSLNFFEKVK